MRVFSLSLFTALAQFTTLCLTLPLELTPRSQFCSNAPTTVAGTLLDRRVVIQATPARVAGTVWCAPHTTTWMLIRLGITFAGTSTTELLIDSYNQIQDQITTVGDGNLVNGMFEFKRYGLQFVATNANNHQLTRAVLEAAITGVWQFIRQLQYQQGVQGTATFQIFDGVNQVGAASIAQIDPS